MDILVSMLVAVHVIVCLLLVLIVLMQRPKQEGLGAAFGGGMTDQVFGAQTTDVLQKGTVWLAVMFFVITMTLAILISKRHSGGSAIDESLSTSDTVIPEQTSGLPELPKPEEALTTSPGSAATEAAGEAKATAADAAEAVKEEAAPKEAKDAAPAKADEAKPAGGETETPGSSE